MSTAHGAQERHLGSSATLRQSWREGGRNEGEKKTVWVKEEEEEDFMPEVVTGEFGCLFLKLHRPGTSSHYVT